MMMKKTLVAMLMAMPFVGASAQTKSGTMYVCQPGGKFVAYDVNDVDSVVYRRPYVYTSCPDDNHPHLIDLGLPSGTLWACCNISSGTQAPKEYGDYITWGGTNQHSADSNGKITYDWSTYELSAGSKDGTQFTSSLENIQGNDSLDTAHKRWGGDWVMPTVTQMQELIDECKWTWYAANAEDNPGGDHPGCKVASKTTGAYIFLPAGGGRWNTDLNIFGSDGLYWSSSLSTQGERYARSLHFGSGSRRVTDGSSRRGGGRSVRPVVCQ